jgi:hypothetical protein
MQLLLPVAALAVHFSACVSSLLLLLLVLLLQVLSAVLNRPQGSREPLTMPAPQLRLLLQ